MSYYTSITQSVGHTPLIQLNALTKGLSAKILLKSEFFNPLGSVKDRIGRAMIEAAEASGELQPGGHIIEPTSGNTGIALAFIAAAKGYQITLTMPESMSLERRTLLALLGANLVLTPAKEGMKGAIRKAEELQAEIPGAWIPQQFNNPANPKVHRETTALEIIDATGGNVDVFVASVGTGGTLSGVGEVLKARYPHAKVIAVEPSDSPVISQSLKGEPLTPGPHKIQGTGAGFIPKNLNTDLLDEVIQVTNDDAIRTARALAINEGILAGISTGANVWAALLLAKRPEFEGKVIVTVGCSTGERYLSTALAEEARSKISS